MRLVAVWLLFLFALMSHAQDAVKRAHYAPNTYIHLTVPNRIKVGQTFDVRVRMEPAASVPVVVHMEQLNLKTSPTTVTLKPGEQQIISGKIISAPTGLSWVSAYTDDGLEGYAAIDTGFAGVLSPLSNETLPYKQASPIALSMTGEDGKSLSVDTPLQIEIESSDALLNGRKGPVLLDMPANVSVSPTFTATPLNFRGGEIHLSAVLSVKDEVSLTTQSFAMHTDPAEWLPILLAILGGISSGLYRAIGRLSAGGQRLWLSSLTLVGTSGLAGFVGYLIANLDLLGLKLDPTNLRTYPLVGFLVAYVGIDVLFKGKLPTPDQTGKADASSPVDAPQPDEPLQAKAV